MDEQAIRNDVLEAESLIRGLAQRMKESSTALQAAETARDGMVAARTALQGSTAQLDNLHRMASDAIRRVDAATQELVQQNSKALEAAQNELTQSTQQLQATRGEILSAVQAAQQATTAALERDTNTLQSLQASAAAVPASVQKTLSAAVQPLLQEAQESRTDREAVQQQLQAIRAEIAASESRQFDALGKMLDALQKQAAYLEETTTFLSDRLQETRNESSSRFSDLETSLQSRVESVNHKAVFLLVLQILLVLGAGAAGFLAAKTVFHF